MPRQVFLFDPPERFVAGTVGQPGERTFFLQASAAGRVVSVALEKVQVTVLAERLEQLLGEVQRRLGVDLPGESAPVVDDAAPLEAPVEEEFRVGTMGLAWDGDDELVVIEAQAQTDRDAEEEAATVLEDVEDGPAVLRVRIGPEAARAFVRRAQRVVAAGRPPCPLCGLPLDPAGHICPRQNGYRR